MRRAQEIGIDVEFILSELCPALESGEYTQGQSFLKRNDAGIISHCCLGVACELKGVPNKETPLSPGRKAYFLFTFEDGTGEGLPTDSFSKQIFGEIDVRLFATLNDANWSFLEISKMMRMMCENDTVSDALYTLSQNVKLQSHTSLHVLKNLREVYDANVSE